MSDETVAAIDKADQFDPIVLQTKKARFAVRLVAGMDCSVFVSTYTGCASIDEFLTPEQARDRAKALSDAADAAVSDAGMDLRGVLEGARLGQAGEGS
jgi:hypothetical protein